MSAAVYCATCGERLYVSRESFWEHWEKGLHRQLWHLTCQPPWQAKPKEGEVI